MADISYQARLNTLLETIDQKYNILIKSVLDS